MVTRSDRLDHVHSDIRGPLYQEALRMESEGINVLKLNTGNPGRFGFKLPNSVRQALALHIDEAVPYCDVRGMAAARNVICTYHIGRGLQGIMPNDVFICNGVSEAASMLLNALIGTGDEILLPSPCYSLWSNNAYLGGDASLACSEQTAAQVDAKVVEIVQAEHKKAYQLLADNKRKLDEIAQYLYEKETISGEEFMRILNAQPQLPAGPSADSTNQAQ